MTSTRFSILTGICAIIAQAIYYNVPHLFFHYSVSDQRLACAFGIDSGSTCATAYAINIATVVMLFAGIAAIVGPGFLYLVRKANRR